MLAEDAQLRVGLLALQRGLINDRQFARACAAWADGEHESLAEGLVARGWLSPDQRHDLETFDESGNDLDSSPTEEQATLTLDRQALDSVLDVDLGDLDFANLSGSFPITMRERIVLRGLHSSGGIGEVWKAYDEVLGREVALKQLKREQADYADNRARFFREARITGQLDHPGVVPVYDYHADEDGTRCFYTMRFLQGRTLSDVIAAFHDARDEHDDFVTGPFLQLLRHFTSICNTMAFAHSRGVVHRDLKGDNIIIGDYGEVIVLDWGLAKRVGIREGQPTPDPADSLTGLPITATMQGERLGTPAFMAPEQAKGDIDRIDQRTDIYGLCAILYDILTGRPPFRGDDVIAVMDDVVRKPPTPPRELIPAIPVELERICLCGLEKSPAARWQSVTELADAVDRWLTQLAERKRTEQERERFFDLSLDLLALLDDEGRVTQANAAWRTILDWAPKAVTGRALLDFVAEDQRDTVATELAALRSGDADEVEFEVRIRCAPRRDADLRAPTRWIDVRARSIPDDDGVYLVGRDVTERRQTEQEFVGLLESAPDATCVIDESGTIVIVNRQLERMFGYAREQLVGQPVEILVPTSLRGRHMVHVRRFIADPSPRPMGSGLALEGQRRDGTVFPVEVSLNAVRTETRMLVSCALRASSRES